VAAGDSTVCVWGGGGRGRILDWANCGVWQASHPPLCCGQQECMPCNSCTWTASLLCSNTRHSVCRTHHERRAAAEGTVEQLLTAAGVHSGDHVRHGQLLAAAALRDLVRGLGGDQGRHQLLCCCSPLLRVKGCQIPQILQHLRTAYAHGVMLKLLCAAEHVCNAGRTWGSAFCAVTACLADMAAAARLLLSGPFSDDTIHKLCSSAAACNSAAAPCAHQNGAVTDRGTCGTRAVCSAQHAVPFDCANTLYVLMCVHGCH
jgi:hypothetical protein